LDTWDVFLSSRLEIQRGLTTAEVFEAFARGDLRQDDLIRLAGANMAWARVYEFPALVARAPERSQIPSAEASQGALTESHSRAGGEFPPVFGAEELPEAAAISARDDFVPPSFGEIAVAPDAQTVFKLDSEDEGTRASADLGLNDPGAGAALEALIDDDSADKLNRVEDSVARSQGAEAGAALDALIDDSDDDLGELDLNLGRDESLLVEAVESEELAAWIDEESEEIDPQDEDEEAAEFTLSRNAPEKVEELDLAAMVDVAFQLVLFFLVTATTVLYKTLEIPKPNPESAAGAATQGQSRTLDDLERDYILVDIDPQGSFKIDHEPVAAQMSVLADRLRAARQSTGRTKMLLTADGVTLHKHAVLAYDAANEIGLRIAISRPAAANAPAPLPPPAVKKADAG
jgi:biopolymer transport protein ExbD